MKTIIPVTDLQRQAAQILGDLNDEPVVITQRGRASAVLLSARRYAEIEEDLQMLDDLEQPSDAQGWYVPNGGVYGAPRTRQAADESYADTGYGASALRPWKTPRFAYSGR